MKHGFVQTKSHGRVHYLETGEGPVLILLHSNGASAFQYEAAMPLFAKSWRTIAMDMPGHGDSDPISRHYKIEDYAEAVVQLMDALKIDKAAVAGDSVGGSICIALARDHAKRTAPVIISECPLRDNAEWEKTWPRIESTYSAPTQDIDELKARLRAGRATPELLKRWNTDRNKAGAWAMVDVMWAMREFDAEGALRKKAGPAAVIVGSTGNVVKNMKPYEEAVGKNLCSTLADCGHFPMIDDPELFTSEVNRLLAAAK